MVRLLFSLLSFTVLTQGCKKEAQTPVVYTNPYADNTPYLDTVWRRQLADDINSSGIFTQIVYANGVIVAGNEGATSGAAVIIRGFDANTGEVLWTWRHSEDAYLNGLSITHNRVVFNTYLKSYCLDLHTGNTLWEHSYDWLSRNFRFETSMYYVASDQPTAALFNELVKVDILTGEQDTIWSKPKAQYYPKIFPPTVFRAINGDTLVAFVDKKGNYEEGTIIDLWLYNTSTRDTVSWQTNVDDARSSALFISPIAFPEADMVIYVTIKYLHAIRISTGELLWTKAYPRYMEGSTGDIGYESYLTVVQPSKIGDCLVFGSDGGIVRKINTAGTELWKITKDFGGGTSFCLDSERNKIYGSFNSIYTIDPASGLKTKIAKPFPNAGPGGYRDAIGFNEEKDYGYVSDGRYLYCFRLK